MPLCHCVVVVGVLSLSLTLSPFLYHQLHQTSATILSLSTAAIPHFFTFTPFHIATLFWFFCCSFHFSIFLARRFRLPVYVLYIFFFASFVSSKWSLFSIIFPFIQLKTLFRTSLKLERQKFNNKFNFRVTIEKN